MSEAPLWAKRWVHFILKDFFFLSGQCEGCLLWTRRAQPVFVLHSDQKVSSSQTEEKHRLSGRNCCQHWPAEVAFEIYSPPPKTSTIPLLVKCGENTSDWKMKNLSTYVQIVPWNSYVLSLRCVFQQPSALCSRFYHRPKKADCYKDEKTWKTKAFFLSSLHDSRTQKQRTFFCLLFWDRRCWNASQKKRRNEKQTRQQQCKLTERLCVSQIWRFHS